MAVEHIHANTIQGPELLRVELPCVGPARQQCLHHRAIAQARRQMQGAVALFALTSLSRPALSPLSDASASLLVQRVLPRGPPCARGRKASRHKRR